MTVEALKQLPVFDAQHELARSAVWRVSPSPSLSLSLSLSLFSMALMALLFALRHRFDRP